ncbi:hypothetical protein MKX08_008249 [Trichoderma sp. CBMAI-0020]|nr:hypothetical protein MKX08_008249 [Trichoderma sp. CBMAI-0020]
MGFWAVRKWDKTAQEEAASKANVQIDRSHGGWGLTKAYLDQKAARVSGWIRAWNSSSPIVVRNRSATHRMV